MTKASFSWSESFCATRRPSVSAVPPGPKGTMTFTGREGYRWTTAGCAIAAHVKRETASEARKRIMRRFYNFPYDTRLHRHPHPRRSGKFPPVCRQRARRAVAVDGARACVPPARDDLGKRVSHGGGRQLERAAAHRGHGRDAHRAPGDLADAGAPLLLAAARRCEGCAATSTTRSL